MIGNAGYRADLGALASPANDAKLMAETLRKCGFTVQTVVDADQKQIKRAIVEFGDKIADAGPKATALFFYTGHGISVRSISYLIPIRAEIAKESDVGIEAVALDDVIQQMMFAGAATSIVIVDASRNNPLARSFRSAYRGLLPLTAMGPNFFIAYSTAPGFLAGYDEGEHSPYVAALTESMLVPGLPIQEVFDRTRKKVIALTEQKQVPWESASMTDPFYFMPQN
ncbi:caspase domain-containing protein [Dongia sp.]|uniref:caspase family protein n=1 Tax=Dongia sp. TaxID=1977262 RepID=UPI0037517FF9